MTRRHFFRDLTLKFYHLRTMKGFIADLARRAIFSIMQVMDLQNPLSSDCSSTGEKVTNPVTLDSSKIVNVEGWEQAPAAKKDNFADLHVPASLSCLTSGAQKGPGSVSDGCAGSPWAIQALHEETLDFDSLPQASNGTVELEMCPIYNANKEKKNNIPVGINVASGPELSCCQENNDAEEELDVFPDYSSEFVISDNAAFDFNADLPIQWASEETEVQTWDNPTFLLQKKDDMEDEITEKTGQQCDLERDISNLMTYNELFCEHPSSSPIEEDSMMTSNPLFEEEEEEEEFACGPECFPQYVHMIESRLSSQGSCSAGVGLYEPDWRDFRPQLCDRFLTAECTAVNSVLIDSNKENLWSERNSMTKDACSFEGSTPNAPCVHNTCWKTKGVTSKSVMDERSEKVTNKKRVKMQNKREKDSQTDSIPENSTKPDDSVHTKTPKRKVGSSKSTQNKCLNPQWVSNEHSFFWDATNAVVSCSDL